MEKRSTINMLLVVMTVVGFSGVLIGCDSSVGGTTAPEALSSEGLGEFRVPETLSSEGEGNIFTSEVSAFSRM